jgi:hypothetical protein
MNAMTVERKCADCPLRAMECNRAGGLPREPERLDAEGAPERQLEQLERSFGADWKW